MAGEIIQKKKLCDLAKKSTLNSDDLFLVSNADGNGSNAIMVRDLKTEITKDIQVDTSNLATKDELATELNKKAEVGHNHDNSYASKSSEHQHSNKSELDKIQTGDKARWDLKDKYPSGLNYIVENPMGGLTKGMDMSVLTFGKILELVFCTPAPKPPAKMYYGWIPKSVHNDCTYANITMVMIKDSRSSVTELEPQTLGKTSLGLIPDEGYCFVAIPSESSLSAVKDNGIGGKVPFYTIDCGAVGTPIKLDNEDYKIYGEIVWAEGQLFTYVD